MISDCDNKYLTVVCVRPERSHHIKTTPSTSDYYWPQQQVSSGRNFYIILVASLASVLAALVILIGLFVCLRHKRAPPTQPQTGDGTEESQKVQSENPLKSALAQVRPHWRAVRDRFRSSIRRPANVAVQTSIGQDNQAIEVGVEMKEIPPKEKGSGDQASGSVFNA